MADVVDEPGVFFVARDQEISPQGFVFGVLSRAPVVDGPYFCKAAAIQAAEAIQDHGTYRIFKGEAVHVVKVERPQVSSEPLA
jgi:hypothetical protein